MIRVSFEKKKITIDILSSEFWILSRANTKFPVKILVTDTFLLLIMRINS